MKKKLRLAFDELEKEMEVIPREIMHTFKGGNGSSGDISFSNTDCVIYSVAFMTGKTYEEVLSSYGTFFAERYGNSNSPVLVSTGINGVLNGGVPLHFMEEFTSYMMINKVGDFPIGTTGYSQQGDSSLAVLDLGNGILHAVVLTGNANAYEYYYYDPQNNVTGTIKKTNIISTFGYENP